jgi:hypothetical protein
MLLSYFRTLSGGDFGFSSEKWWRSSSRNKFAAARLSFLRSQTQNARALRRRIFKIIFSLLDLPSCDILSQGVVQHGDH